MLSYATHEQRSQLSDISPQPSLPIRKRRAFADSNIHALLPPRDTHPPLILEHEPLSYRLQFFNTAIPLLARFAKPYICVRSVTFYYLQSSELNFYSIYQGNMDNSTIGIIIFFVISSYFGHVLLHRVIKTPAQYERPRVASAEYSTEDITT